MVWVHGIGPVPVNDPRNPAYVAKLLLEKQAAEKAAAAERERIAAESRRIAAEEIEKARLADEAKRKAEEEARKAAQPPAPPQDLPQTTTPTIDLPVVRDPPPGGQEQFYPGGQEQLPPAKSNTGLLLALGAGGLALLFFANKGD
jgi:hypothetical protein